MISDDSRDEAYEVSRMAAAKPPVDGHRTINEGGYRSPHLEASYRPRGWVGAEELQDL